MAIFRAATTTIPLVALGSIPADLIDRLAHPGGNLTGLDVMAGGELVGKGLQVLQDAIPSASRIAVLTQHVFWENERGGSLRRAAPQLGLTIEPVLLTRPISEAALRSAVASISDGGFDAIWVGALGISTRALAAELITATGLPSISYQTPYAREGVLISYTTDRVAMYRRAASFVDRILKGGDPGDMLIELPMKFELVVNLKTAKALGITLPLKIMFGATEVIE